MKTTRPLSELFAIFAFSAAAAGLGVIALDGHISLYKAEGKAEACAAKLKQGATCTPDEVKATALVERVKQNRAAIMAGWAGAVKPPAQK